MKGGDARSPLPLTCCETTFSDGSGIAFSIEICLMHLRLWWDCYLLNQGVSTNLFILMSHPSELCQKSHKELLGTVRLCVGVD